MVGWTDGQMDGQLNGWTRRWKDGPFTQMGNTERHLDLERSLGIGRRLEVAEKDSVWFGDTLKCL